MVLWSKTRQNLCAQEIQGCLGKKLHFWEIHSTMTITGQYILNAK